MYGYRAGAEVHAAEYSDTSASNCSLDTPRMRGMLTEPEMLGGAPAPATRNLTLEPGRSSCMARLLADMVEFSLTGTSRTPRAHAVEPVKRTAVTL